MAVNTIETPDGRTRGYQARVHVLVGHPPLTRFYAYLKYGGKRKARALAKLAEAQLKRQAQRVRKRLLQDQR